MSNSKPKASVFELDSLLNEPVWIDCIGDHTVEGTLKGFDQLLNLNIENGSFDGKQVGNLIVRGPSVMSVLHNVNKLESQ